MKGVINIFPQTEKKLHDMWAEVCVCVFHKKENSELVENISEQRKDALQFDFFSVSSWKLFMKFLKIQTLHRISDLLLKLTRAIKLLKYNISEEKKMGKVGASHSIETIFGVKPFSS